MIAASISIAPPPIGGVVAPPKGAATGDFVSMLAAVIAVPKAVKAASPPSPSTDKATRGTAEIAPVVGPGLDGPALAGPSPVDLVDPTDENFAVPVIPGAADRIGHDIAGDGKALPGDSDEDDATPDPIWLPAAFVMPVPVPTMRALPSPAFGGTVAALGSNSAPVLPTAAPAETGGKVGGEAIATSQPSPNWAPASAGEDGVMKQTPAVPVSRQPDTAALDVPIRIDTPAPVAPQQVQAPAPIALPAGQVFAAAIAAAGQTQARREDADTLDSKSPLAITTATPLDAVRAQAIQATADAKQGALDLRQDKGLQGMIDHIETLRDGADANDTRIRLVPDALGAVDVSVRKDGERVHVHFAAENQASARLISDAQPRLAELAEARGVKLGQTSVGAGTDSGGQAQQPYRPAGIARAAPASAAPASAGTTDFSTTTDTRIA